MTSPLEYVTSTFADVRRLTPTVLHHFQNINLV